MHNCEGLAEKHFSKKKNESKYIQGLLAYFQNTAKLELNTEDVIYNLIIL